MSAIQTPIAPAVSKGLGIQQAAERLRNYLWIERACVKICAGWWLAVRPYEQQYRLGYHLYDHAWHVTALRERLGESDARSQLFADQDWSDEINHVRYGSTWTDYLLQEDSREIEDVIEEVKQHLARVTGGVVTGIEAPF